MSSIRIAIGQNDGLTFSLSPYIGRLGVLNACLEGPGLHAQTNFDCEPAFPVLGKLPDFLSAVAGSGAANEVTWTSLGEDVRLKANAENDGFVTLRVYMGSTSDDACDWMVNASLRVSRHDMRRFAEETGKYFIC